MAVINLLATATCSVLVFFWFMTNVAFGQQSSLVSGGDSSAVVQGSLRQRDLLEQKDREIEILKRELARLQKPDQNSTDNEVARRTTQSTAPLDSGATASTADKGAVNDSVADKPASSSKISRSTRRISLDGRWHVELGPEGPIHYISLLAARAIETTLPAESDCSAIATGLNNNTSILRSLIVHGFPVTSFWVVRNSGRLGICRVSKISGNRYRGRVSSKEPTRSEKALVAQL